MTEQNIGLTHRPQPLANTPAAETTGRLNTAATAPLLLALFIFSVVPPVYFSLGDTRLSITRVVLLVLFVPLLFRLLRGTAGRLMAIDILMLCYAAWIVITILYNNGTERLPLAIVTVLELLGGYLVGRTLIRNSTDHKILMRCLVITLLVILPVAILEFFTNKNLLKEIFGVFFSTFEKPLSQTWRNGFSRVSSGFEHPILHGLFCAVTVAPLFYFYRENFTRAIVFSTMAFALTYMSLSSAPIIAAAICILLILWDHVTGGRWKALLWIGLALFIFLSVASNRGPLVIMIDYLTFNPQTAWTRIWTYQYGSIQVMKHPFLGMGIFSQWPRPAGLTPSVDNFWLLTAMRHGLVGLGFLVFAISFGLWAVIRASSLDKIISAWRTGYVIALVGLFFSLSTVHVWGDTSSFLMFFIGSGIWFASNGASSTTDLPESSTLSRPVSAYPSQRNIPSLIQQEHGRSLPNTRFVHRHDRRSQ